MRSVRTSSGRHSSLELVLAVLHLFFVDVRRVGAAGGHGDGKIPAVAERRERQPENGSAGEAQLAAVDAHFVEAELAVPAQVRIDHGDGSVHGCARGGQQHLVGAAIGHRIGLDAAALQVAAGFAFRPAPDDVAAQRDDLPRLELRRPGRDLFGMLLHELLHAGLKGFADGAQVGVASSW